MTAMTTMTDVFDDLRSAQDDLVRISRAHSLGLGATASTRAWPPAVDIFECEDSYLVDVELPGVKIEDIDITVDEGLLTIQGERTFAHDQIDKAHRVERRVGPFSRSITLPSHVKADTIDASIQDGLLMVRVPKTTEAHVRRISVRPGTGKAALAASVVKNGERMPSSGQGTGEPAHSN
jgi:HSP20 family protein